MSHHRIEDCIRNCEQVGKQLREICNWVDDQRARYTLTEAVRHVEECIHECNEAILAQRLSPGYGGQEPPRLYYQ